MTTKSVDNPSVKRIKKHLREKRNELIWALEAQDYSQTDLGDIFNLNRSTVLRILEKKPRGWVTPYFKVRPLS